MSSVLFQGLGAFRGAFWPLGSPPCGSGALGKCPLAPLLVPVGPGSLGAGALRDPQAPSHAPLPGLGTCPGVVCVRLSCRQSSSTSPIVQKEILPLNAHAVESGAERVFYQGVSRGERCCSGCSSSPLILRLKSSHAADQALSPVAWGADRRGSWRKHGPSHPTQGVGL